MVGTVPQLLQFASLPIAYLRRNGNFVKRQTEGGRALGSTRNAAVFVHFDPKGVVHDYVVYNLQALVELGYEIVFVTNSPRFDATAAACVRDHVTSIIVRRNAGYDFLAYRDGLRALGDLSRFESVILANDSVYGPLFNLRTCLRACGGDADVWGMTDSWDGRYHLQSYFLLLRHTVLRHPAFARFWESVLPLHSKRAVVRFYEMGFTQAMLKAGIVIRALYPYRDAAADLLRFKASGELAAGDMDEDVAEYLNELVRRVRSGAPLNPTHHFFDHLIVHKRCPFLKRDLVGRNPGKVPHAFLWEVLIRSASSYDTNLIVRHLERTARNRVP